VAAGSGPEGSLMTASFELDGLQMSKIEIEGLERAYESEEAVA
jgi:hypothetical protein